jgi:SAM-dependent methyltransferase
MEYGSPALKQVDSLMREYLAHVDNSLNGDCGHFDLQKDALIAAIHEQLKLAARNFGCDSGDPYSVDYLSQMVEIYRAVSGRPSLDQENNELHPVNVAFNVQAPNPSGILGNPSFVSEHIRSASLMLSLLELRGQACVLDMGVGAGLTSEIYSCAGADVTAVDLDPEMVRVGVERAIIRQLNIRYLQASYEHAVETLTAENAKFDAVIFFQSFHHCVTPWKLLESLQAIMRHDSVVIFTGEPIDSPWWKHWGLRFDHESLYVARKYGWFENGWSVEFAASMADRAGLKHLFLSGGHEGGYVGIYSKSQNRLNQLAQRGDKLGLRPGADFGGRLEPTYYSLGLAADSAGPSIVRKFPCAPQYDVHDLFVCPGVFACYGPYIEIIDETLVLCLLENSGNEDLSLSISLYSEGRVLKDEILLLRARCKAVIKEDTGAFRGTKNLEFRIFCVEGTSSLNMLLPRFV